MPEAWHGRRRSGRIGDVDTDPLTPGDDRPTYAVGATDPLTGESVSRCLECGHTEGPSYDEALVDGRMLAHLETEHAILADIRSLREN